jgi:hypothetical protein
MNNDSAPHPTVPDHLPDRLAICFYVWSWIFEDAYADLDKAMRETKERGFNCVRVDTGALLAHDQQGKPRGVIRIRPWIEDWNNVPYPLRAQEVDVLERVLELFRVADKHDMTVICTSWLYQDLVTQLADPVLHAEIIAIPYKDRIMELARQHDRLVTLLKERGLAHRIAFVEVLNEAEFSPLFVPKTAPTAPPTFEEFARWTWPELADKAASAQEFSRAVRHLRERHRDILFTMDYAWSGSLDDLWAPDSQLVDFHYYHGLLNKLFKLLDFPMDREPDLDARPELRRFLVPNPSSWLEFREKVRHLRHVGAFWHTASWLYHNLDMKVFDAWYKQDAEANEAYYVSTAETWMGKAREFARERGLPLVLDETGAFWPPINTGIYADPVGQRHEEILVDIAIRDGYWGIMPTASMSPYMPYWNDPAVVRWLQRVNARIRRRAESGG